MVGEWLAQASVCVTVKTIWYQSGDYVYFVNFIIVLAFFKTILDQIRN